MSETPRFPSVDCTLGAGVRRVYATPAVLRKAARLLDREARELHDAFTTAAGIWECAKAKAQADELRQVARDLRQEARS